MNKNQCKITTNLLNNQIVAGVLPSDSNIEFLGIKENKQVLWLQNGSNHYFDDLPLQYFNLLKEAYKKDAEAQQFLEGVTHSFRRQLELYTYYMYGALDCTPDIENGVLSPSENFRHSTNCPSLRWRNKNITVNGIELTKKELFITDMYNEDIPDKAIWSSLGISESYFNQIKQKMYSKAGVRTKPSYIKKVIKEQII